MQLVARGSDHKHEVHRGELGGALISLLIAGSRQMLDHRDKPSGIWFWGELADREVGRRDLSHLLVSVQLLFCFKKVNPQSMVHLTEKPVELAVRAIQYSSLTGDNVLDLFGGSGSSLIACVQTGRKAFLIELDPLYCDVIVER